jgi:HPt (histidine-containing phosphotransfer) domain-containing protein
MAHYHRGKNVWDSPVDNAELYGIAAFRQGTVIAAQPLPMGSAPGSIDTRNILAVCQTDGVLNRALLREMLGYFIDENERRVIRAQEAVVAGDRQELRQLAHALRGSAAMLGAGHLHDLAWSLEMDCATGDVHELAREVAKIRTEVDAVFDTIRRTHADAWADD